LDPAVVVALERAMAQVRAAPREAEAWGRLGTVFMVQEFRVEAIPCFRAAERLDPTEPRWPYFLGVCLSVGDPGSAIPALSRAARLCGEGRAPAVWVRLGEVLLRQGEQERAKRAFESALKAGPQPRAELGLARGCWARKDLAGCLTRLGRCVQNPLTEKPARALRAEVYHRQGKADAAEQERQRAVALRDPQPMLDPYLREAQALGVGRGHALRRAEALVRQGQTAAGIALLVEVARDYPSSEKAWQTLGWALLEARDPFRAEHALRRAVAVAPRYAEGQFYLGVSLFRQGRAREAAQHFRLAAEVRPDDGDAHHNLGRCLDQVGDCPGALAAFRAAVRSKPYSAESHGCLGELLLREGKLTDARRHLATAVRLAPSNPRWRRLEGVLPPRPAGTSPKGREEAPGTLLGKDRPRGAEKP
jgi:tetratricopeptide (TPR) repeat protein